MNDKDYYEACWLPGVHRINEDKPHRCPRCHSVMVRGFDARKIASTHIILCINCETQITRWPRLAGLWARLGRTYARMEN